MSDKILDLKKLQSKDPKVKYGFAKELLRLGADQPQALYPYFDHWLQMVSGENQILKWTAIDIIGYISAVDTEGKTDQVIDSFIRLLHAGHLISCSHAIFALGHIAKNKPAQRLRILNELVLINQDTFDTQTCMDIATNKVLATLKDFSADIKSEKAVMAFICEAQESARTSTVKKAKALLKKIEKITT